MFSYHFISSACHDDLETRKPIFFLFRYFGERELREKKKSRPSVLEAYRVFLSFILLESFLLCS